MFFEFIGKDDLETLKNSDPLYKIPEKDLEKLVDKFYLFKKKYVHEFFSKDTETFEQIWRLNDEVPERQEHFHNLFPRKSSNLDAAHHYSNFSMYGYCSRWLPSPVLHILFPFHWLVYDSDGNKRQGIINNKESSSQDNSKLVPKLTARAVPTALERNACKLVEGNEIWDRMGNWACLKKGKKNLIINEKDEMGENFFQSFNEYCRWKKILNEKVLNCLHEENCNDNEIKRLQDFRKKSIIPVDLIVDQD